MRAAPVDPSPTPANALGVDPICTRNPVCPLHDRSLDTLVAKGRPVAVLFATPARCTSQYCGPVLDSLLPLVETYQDRVDVVHVDIFKNLQTDETSPTVTAWGLPSEPWLFGIDAAGVITARLDGAFGQDEMRACSRISSACREDLSEPRYAFERRYENDWPQPQVRCAFGFEIVNPAPWRPSL